MGETLSKTPDSSVGSSEDGVFTYKLPSGAKISKLMEAARTGNVEICEKLLKRGKKINKKDERGAVALHHAVWNGQLATVIVLLSKKDVDPNARNSDGFSPLHYALLLGRKDIAEALFQHGAEVNARFGSNPGVSFDYCMNASTSSMLWRVPNFSKIKERKVSAEPFQIGGCKWRLVLYPKGSKNDGNLSLYLEAIDDDHLPDGKHWSYMCTFTFSILDQLSNCAPKIIREVITHKFYKNHSDLGFPQLVKKSMLQDKTSGILVNDTLVVDMNMEVSAHTTCFLEDMSGISTWKIISVSHMKERVSSPTFKIAGCKWTMGVYLRGKGGGNFFSVYLKVADTSAFPPDWSFLVNFKFSIINQKDGSFFSRQVETKTFKRKVEDWGFPQFLKLSTLFDYKAGYIVDDSLIIECQLEVLNSFKRRKIKLKKENFGSGFTPLHFAVYKGHVEGVRFLLEQGATNTPDSKGRTPLDWAAYRDDYKIVKLLCKASDADVNCKDIEGYTPLHKAIVNGNDKIMKLLLKMGAKVSLTSNTGATPLQLAIMTNKLTCTEKLVRNFGADVNFRDKRGRNPLHWCAFRGDFRLLTLIHQLGGDLNIGDNDGHTPLHKAVLHGYPEFIRYIIDNGGDIEARSNKGYTPLHIAISSNNLQAVSLLLDCGADVNSPDIHGYSPLHKATKNGFMLMIQLLMKRGARINVTSNKAISPLQLAIRNNDLRVGLHLLQNGAEITGPPILKFVMQKVSKKTPPIEEIVKLPNKDSLGNELVFLLDNPEYSDVTFVIEGKTLRCWKGILVARSEYFKTMFTTPMRESEEKEIEIEDISYKTFYTTMYFLYSGQIPKDMNLNKLLRLLTAANRFMLQGLKTLCELDISRLISVDNVCHIYREADLYRARKLRRVCVYFITQHASELTDVENIIKSDSFRTEIISFINKFVKMGYPHLTLYSPDIQ